jgi:hypothetical protein
MIKKKLIIFLFFIYCFNNYYLKGSDTQGSDTQGSDTHGSYLEEAERISQLDIRNFTVTLKNTIFNNNYDNNEKLHSYLKNKLSEKENFTYLNIFERKAFQYLIHKYWIENEEKSFSHTKLIHMTHPAIKPEENLTYMYDFLEKKIQPQ